MYNATNCYQLPPLLPLQLKHWSNCYHCYKLQCLHHTECTNVFPYSMCVVTPWLPSLHLQHTQTQATTTVDPQPPLQNQNDCSPHILNQQTNAIFVTDSKLSGVCDAIATPQKTTSLYNLKQSTHWARFGWNAFHQTVVMPCTGNDYLQSFILSVFGNTP